MNFEAFWAQAISVAGPYLPRVLGAVAVFIIGWLIALLVAGAVRAALRRTTIDNRLASWITGDQKESDIDVESLLSRGVYYLLMIFVLVAVFQTLGLAVVTEPLSRLLTELFEYAPRILGAGALLLLAWLLASGLRLLLLRVLTAAKADERLGDQNADAPGEPTVTKSVAEAVYWLVFLLFLPGVLDALALEGMLAPVRDVVNEIVGFLPNLFTAAITVVVGWFVARVVQRIATSFLAALGADALSDRVGLGAALGARKLSEICGLVVYVFLFIPILIAALSALELQAVTTPLSNMLNTILDAIPSVFAALLVLTVSYVGGRLAAALVVNLLSGIGFNTLAARLGIVPEGESEGGNTPASIVGSVVVVAVMLFAISEAAQLLGFDVLTEMIAEFMVFAGHILVGLTIFGIGLYFANAAAQAISGSHAANASVLAVAAKVAVLLLSGAMALRQMGLANEIINLAFGLTLGAAAVAIAIAFGIGGRELAARQLQNWHRALSSGSDARNAESPSR